jgi:hypothetical protein
VIKDTNEYISCREGFLEINIFTNGGTNKRSENEKIKDRYELVSREV